MNVIQLPYFCFEILGLCVETEVVLNTTFLFFLFNLFAEKSEQIVEPPQPSQKKKVRRETWSHITGPYKAYANDC